MDYFGINLFRKALPFPFEVARLEAPGLSLPFTIHQPERKDF